jgi:hypothetical protein
MKMEKEALFHFDNRNPDLLVSLMKQYGSDNQTFAGKNEKGERVLFHIFSNEIVVTTFQNNGWMRINYYDENGFFAGETYEK